MKTLFALALAMTLAGCGSSAKNVAAVSAGLAVGTFVPGAEIEQIYYLGVIDPIEQIPQAIYRVRVRGQASMISNVSFASGWVPAWTIDSLNAKVTGSNAAKNPWLPANCDDTVTCSPPTGRRLVQFGPEGFREAPRDYRLVIVMGADPSKFFGAVDRTLGIVSGVKLDNDNAGIRKDLTTAMLQLKKDQDQLKRVQLQVLEEGLK